MEAEASLGHQEQKLREGRTEERGKREERERKGRGRRGKVERTGGGEGKGGEKIMLF